MLNLFGSKSEPESAKREPSNLNRYTIISGVLATSLAILALRRQRQRSWPLRRQIRTLNVINERLRLKNKEGASIREEERARALELLENTRKERDDARKKLDERKITIERQSAQIVANDERMKELIQALLQDKGKFRFVLTIGIGGSESC